MAGVVSRDLNIDWQQLALNLRTCGQVLTVLSKQLGLHEGYLCQLARGEINEPRFSIGLRLLNLHLDVCGAERQRALIR